MLYEVNLPTDLLIDNLIKGQARDKHGGVDKPLFLPLLIPL